MKIIRISLMPKVKHQISLALFYNFLIFFYNRKWRHFEKYYFLLRCWKLVIFQPDLVLKIGCQRWQVDNLFSTWNQHQPIWKLDINVDNANSTWNQVEIRLVLISGWKQVVNVDNPFSTLNLVGIRLCAEWVYIKDTSLKNSRWIIQ